MRVRVSVAWDVLVDDSDSNPTDSHSVYNGHPESRFVDDDVRREALPIPNIASGSSPGIQKELSVFVQ